jgi:hypothetical protein
MPLYTPVSVCNLALAKVGDESAQITSIPATPSEEYSNEANLCAKFYETTLREVLEATEWKWARKRATLALNVGTPTFEWTYSHALPADCARPLKVSSTTDTQRQYNYTSEWDVEDGNVVSNQSELWMLYVANVSTLNKADALFIKTLYTALAAKLVFPLTENRNLTKDIMNEYEQSVLPEARRVNSYSGRILPTVDSGWLNATHNSSIYDINSRFDLDDNYGTVL